MFFCGKTFKLMAVIICLLIILTGAIGGTVSFLTQSATPIQNDFSPAKVTCQVEETFSGDVKKNVSVRNTSDIPAYIRLTLVVNWVDEQSGKVHATTPVAGTDYSIEWVNSFWMQGTDGFWYYPFVVPSGEKTPDLIQRVEVVGQPPEGFRLSIQILASAIQSQPAKVVEEAWGVTVSGTSIRPKTAP